jgi:hypothetical protein
MLVFYVFPVFMMAVHILKGVVLFKRGRIVDKEVCTRLARSLCLIMLPH